MGILMMFSTAHEVIRCSLKADMVEEVRARITLLIPHTTVINHQNDLIYSIYILCKHLCIYTVSNPVA